MTAPVCAAALPTSYLAGRWIVCGFPAVDLWRYACVHEHVADRWTCAAHRPEPGAVGCQRCWEAGHECNMIAVRLDPGCETGRT